MRIGAAELQALRRLPRIAVAATVMGGLLWTATQFALARSGLHGLVQAAVLLVLIVGGMAIYGLLLSLFGVTGWREALGAVRQTHPDDLRA